MQMPVERRAWTTLNGRPWVSWKTEMFTFSVSRRAFGVKCLNLAFGIDGVMSTFETKPNPTSCLPVKLLPWSATTRR